MKPFNRVTLLSAVIIASIWTLAAPAAQAQQAAPPKSPTAEVRSDAKARAADSVSVEDVQKAAAQLAIAVQEAVRKATEDPAVKVAALNVAKNAVTAAQVVITQQAETLQTVLDALAKEIAQATAKQQSKTRNH